MDYPTHPKRPGKEKKGGTQPLKYSFDGHFLPNTPSDGDTSKTESYSSETTTRKSSELEYSGPHQTVSVAAGFRLIADTMLRMELAELEMMKRREAARLEAQKRQSDLEDELTRMMLQTQSQIATFVSQNTSTSRKRKSSRNSTDITGKS